MRQAGWKDRMLYRDVYRLPIKQSRHGLPNTEILLDPSRYALFEEPDSRLIRYMLDLNLESVSSSNLVRCEGHQ
jgi:hypothetical protein